MADLEDLINKIMVSVEADSTEVVFTTTDGEIFKLCHFQDCCERVYIESIVGDLSDLVGHPIRMADESSSGDHPSDYEPSGFEDSFTWTFYRFSTIKGYVDIRFLGESNGYYSERVDFVKVGEDLL